MFHEGGAARASESGSRIATSLALAAGGNTVERCESHLVWAEPKTGPTAFHVRFASVSRRPVPALWLHITVVLVIALLVGWMTGAQAAESRDGPLVQALRKLEETAKPGTVTADRLTALNEAIHQLEGAGRQEEIEPLLDEELLLVKRQSRLPDVSELARGLDLTEGLPLPNATPPEVRQGFLAYLQLDHFKAVAGASLLTKIRIAARERIARRWTVGHIGGFDLTCDIRPGRRDERLQPELVLERTDFPQSIDIGGETI
jgi:hypothetical protein